MVVFLSYDLSTFIFMEYSCAKIYARPSMLKSVKRPYVFTIVFLSYSMYSHDFSCFSPGIRVYEGRPPNYLLDGEELYGLWPFSKDARM
jgi:hypothetical protein